jgi:hypothetical protein
LYSSFPLTLLYSSSSPLCSFSSPFCKLPSLFPPPPVALSQASLSTDVQQRAYELVELSKNAATFAAAFPLDASSAAVAVDEEMTFLDAYVR